MVYRSINRNKLHKLLEINKLLTKSLDLDFVLNTLVKAAGDLIEVSDTIILYLYDSAERVLKVAEGVGINKDVMQHIAFAPGESITGKVFLEKTPVLFAHELDIRSSMANISPKNYYYYYKGVYERQIRSTFCVPLVYQERCLGVLVVDNFENEGHFTEDDLNVIELIADQSAIAIVNSTLVQSLKSKNKQLSQSLDIHQRFTKIILEGGGINPILSLLRRILQSSTKFIDSPETDDELYLFPIIRGQENFGYLQLDRPIKSLSSIELTAIEHAATAVSLELIKQNALYEKELHLREELFHQMIQGSTLGQLTQMAKQLKWDPEWNLQCMIIEGRNQPLWKPDSVRDKEKLVKSIENICRSYNQYGLVFTIGFQIVVLLPFLKEELTKQIAKGVEHKWGQMKEMIFGVGRNTHLSQIGDSYEEAVEAARYAKTKEDRTFIDFSKLGAERLWQKLDPATLNHFVKDIIGPLFSSSHEYLETLAKLIELNKNHKEAAKSLHIHKNTLYYRLKKIEHILNISLDDETEWVNLVLAYNIFVSSTKK